MTQLLHELPQFQPPGLEALDAPSHFCPQRKDLLCRESWGVWLPSSCLGGRGLSDTNRNGRGGPLKWWTPTMKDQRRRGGEEPADEFFLLLLRLRWFFRTSYLEIEVFKLLILFSCETLAPQECTISQCQSFLPCLQTVAD